MAAETDEMEHPKEPELSLPILYSENLKNTTSDPGCLIYSTDDQICLINNSAIHILEMQSAPDKTAPQLVLFTALVPSPKDDLLFDVGINTKIFCQQPNDFEESYAFGLDISLNPNRGNAVPHGYATADWSPSNCSPNGRSMLATVTTYGCAYIHGPATYSGKWKTLVNLSEYLSKDLKANSYSNCDDGMHHIATKVIENKELSEKFTLYKQRQYYLAISGISWCPIELESTDQEPVTKKRVDYDSEGHIKHLLLAACNKLGWIFIFRIKIDLQTENVEPCLEHTIKPGFVEFATNIAWYQETASSLGYIAVAFSNGCIRICTLKTTVQGELFNYKDIQSCDVWTSKDLMAAKFMQWIVNDNSLILVVTKMTDILVFKITRDADGLIVSHSYELGPSSHRLPITSLCCHNDLVATAGLDGIIQYFKLGSEVSQQCKNLCKTGYSCMGMAISHNGLLMAQVLCPTAIIYIHGRFRRPLETIVTPFSSLEDAAKKFADPCQPLSLELCEFLRVMSKRQVMPSILKEMSEIDITDEISMLQLQKIEFIKELLNSKKIPDEDGENLRRHEKFRFRIVRERLCREQLKSLLHVLNNDKEVHPTEKDNILLMADWLVLNSYTKSSLEIATSSYAMLNESSSVEMAENIWQKRTLAREIQTTQTASEPSDQNKDQSAISLMPAREICPVCKGGIQLDSELFAECSKSHQWKRCHISLRILFSLQYRTCKCCHRHAQSKCFDFDSKLKFFANSINVDNCLFCNGKLVVMG